MSNTRECSPAVKTSIGWRFRQFWRVYLFTTTIFTWFLWKTIKFIGKPEHNRDLIDDHRHLSARFERKWWRTTSINTYITTKSEIRGTTSIFTLQGYLCGICHYCTDFPVISDITQATTVCLWYTFIGWLGRLAHRCIDDKSRLRR